ncbi:MAG: hypothetical protein CSB44_09985 [Gammaproteobacteria bacterium]|nr:MAG: hypothetical protein CSB44_09985 [Gammaproteobacteria bacterium]
MLLDIRETVRHSRTLKYVIVLVIAVPLVAVFIGSYFAGRPPPAVATVGKTEISPSAVETAVARQRRQLASMFGGEIPEGFASDAMLREQAINGLIDEAVVENTVAAQKFAVGDETLGRAIRAVPAFQTDGRFDPELYEERVRAEGLTMGAFEQRFRSQSALDQFTSGVVSTSFLLPNERARLDALARQQRTIEGLRLDMDAARDAIEVSDDEVQAYFDERADSYQHPDRVKIAYVRLSAEDLASGIDIAEEDAQYYYDDNSANYITPEQREASHILLEADRDNEDEIAEKEAELEAVKARIEAGESFADLAAELSDDVGSASNGGSLGVITPGAMVPEFEAAVYALPGDVGSLSDPVVSDFGVHLIKLDKVVAEKVKPFEDVREDIIAQLRRNEVDSEYQDLHDQLAELAFENPESLEEVSAATGLEVQQTDWIDAENPAEGIVGHPAVLDAALSADVREDGNNSEPIDVDSRDVVVLRVTDSEGPRQKTLDEVRDEVSLALRTERAAEALDAAAADIEAGLLAGDELAVLAEGRTGAELVEALPLSRNSDDFEPSMINAVFSLPKPTEGQGVAAIATLSDDDRVVYRLVDVKVPETAENSAVDDAPTKAAADPQLGVVEFEALVGALRSRADIDISSP